MTKVEKCFCAFCKNERNIDNKKHIGYKEFFSSTILGVLLCLVLNQKVDASFLAFSVSFLGFFQFFIHLKWRIGLVCKYCGFDPILYKKNSELACQKVKAFILLRKSDPSYFLSGKTLGKLAKRSLNEKELQDIALEKSSKLALDVKAKKEGVLLAESELLSSINQMQPM